MVSLAKTNKVDTRADKQGGEPRLDNATAALPERPPLERLSGRGETVDKGGHSVLKTLGLSEKATNQDVINALYKEYNRDYRAMYRGAQRDFGIAVGTLVDAKEKPFASGDTAHGQGGAGSSGATTTPETPFQTFLRKKGLDGSSTNGELIRKLYERYGSNDRTTYARARRELGINIDDLTSKRDQRIDGTIVVGTSTGERNAQASPIPHSPPPPVPSAPEMKVKVGNDKVAPSSDTKKDSNEPVTVAPAKVVVPQRQEKVKEQPKSDVVAMKQQPTREEAAQASLKSEPVGEPGPFGIAPPAPNQIGSGLFPAFMEKAGWHEHIELKGVTSPEKVNEATKPLEFVGPAEVPSLAVASPPSPVGESVTQSKAPESTPLQSERGQVRAGDLIRYCYRLANQDDRKAYQIADQLNDRHEILPNLGSKTVIDELRKDRSRVIDIPNELAEQIVSGKGGEPVAATKSSESQKVEKAAEALVYRDSQTRALPWALDQSYEIAANPTIFGGPGDSLTRHQKGSIDRQPLVSAQPEEDVYIAWFMPDQEKLFGLPDTSQIFGPSVESWKGERIAKANEALRHFMVEVTRVDEDGTRHTALAQPIDRGPNKRFYTRESNPLPRIDGSSKLWENLGILDKTSGPNKAENQVKLTIRLVPKDPTKSLNDLLVDLGVENDKKQLTAKTD
jgi:hypothetical protein